MSGGKSGSAGQAHDYYGSIAGESNCERLDFIWGVLKDDKIVWPECKEWVAKYWKANSIVARNGVAYQTATLTGEVPPNVPWTIYAPAWVPQPWPAGSRVFHNGSVWTARVDNSQEPGNSLLWLAALTPKEWTANGWANGSIVVYNGRIWEATDDAATVPGNPPWILFKRDRASANPFKFTIPNLCEAFLYWGTPDQVLDPVDEGFLSKYGHPPYRWRTVLALKKCLFGTEIQTAPNITVLGGRAPQQSLIVGPAAALDLDWQANVWCVIAELLTHPVIGYGWPLERFHRESWQAQADWCYARAAQTYISPYYDSQASVRAVVADLLSYVDGFIFWNADGLLEAGHWPHGEAPPVFTPSNTVGPHDLTGEIQWDTDSFNGTSSATIINFQDIAAAFNTVPAQAPNLLNRIISRRAKSRTIDRPFIVRSAQATALATEDAKLNGEPYFKGTLPARAEKARAVKPGKLFQLTDDALQMTRISRCLSRTISAPPTGTVKFGFESERGVSEQPYQATQPNPDSDSKPAPALITDYQLVQIPDALAEDGGSFHIACLAARNNAITTSVDVWWKQAEATEAFEQLATLRSFATAGTANASINTADAVSEVVTSDSAQGNTYPLANSDVWNLTLQWQQGGAWTNGVEGTDYTLDPIAGAVSIVAGGAITNGSLVRVTYSCFVHVSLSPETPLGDFESISAPLTADEVNNNTLLLFALNAADPRSFEIMSVKSVEAAGDGFYRVRVRRNSYGTKSGGDGVHVWNANDRIFIAFRSGLTLLSHESFESLAESEGTAVFRLAPASAWVRAEVEDVFDDTTNPGGLTTEFEYTFNDPYAPVVSWLSLQRNGTEISDFTAACAETDKFLFTFKLTDANGDLSQATLSARLGSVEQTLWSQTLSPAFEVVKAAQFTISYPGAWQIVCTVSDASGNVKEFPLTGVGGSDPVYLNIQGPLPTAPSPVVYGYNVIDGYICQLLFGFMEVGLTVLYQVQALNAPYSDSAWSVAPPWGVAGQLGQRYGTVPNFPKRRTLYAKVQKSGYADSAVVHWNY